MTLLAPFNLGNINTGSRYASVYCRGEEDEVCLMGHIIYTENPERCNPDNDEFQGAVYPLAPGQNSSSDPTGQLCFWEGGRTNLVFPIFHPGIFGWLGLLANRAALEAALAGLLDLLAGRHPEHPGGLSSLSAIGELRKQLAALQALLPFAYGEPGGQPWGNASDGGPTLAELESLGYAMLLLFGEDGQGICPDDLKPFVDLTETLGISDLAAQFGFGGGEVNPLGTKKECITIKDNMNPKEGTVTLTGNKRTTRKRDCPPTVDVQWKFVPRVGHNPLARGKIILRAKKKPGDPFWNNPCFIDIVAHWGGPFDIGISDLDPHLPVLPRRILTSS
jgi:hypothetical protein